MNDSHVDFDRNLGDGATSDSVQIARRISTLKNRQYQLDEAYEELEINLKKIKAIKKNPDIYEALRDLEIVIEKVEAIRKNIDTLLTT